MTNEEKLIKNKLTMLELADYLDNVSKACKITGYSRDTFYRVKEQYDSGGIEAIKEANRRKPNLKNRMALEIEEKILKMALEQPAWGHQRTANELKQEGVIVSASGVRWVWLRHGLNNFKLRLKNLEEHVAKTGEVLTENQLVALEQAKLTKEAHGEIETHHPGFLGAQDTVYIGYIKGVGKIYQQTFVDTYSQVAEAKLYEQKVPLTAADVLNDKVLPFYKKQNVDLLRILTDRGTEYCGRDDTHPYELFLAINDIEHTKTKARSPQTNGICERLNRTMQDEFYKVVFRKKIYTTIEELQTDLDLWLTSYNHRRTNQGKNCKGRTPMRTFIEDKYLAIEKNLSAKELDKSDSENSIETGVSIQNLTEDISDLAA